MIIDSITFNAAKVNLPNKAEIEQEIILYPKMADFNAKMLIHKLIVMSIR